MSLDARGEVVSDEQTSPLVHDEALETTAASKEIAGKSPTAIAFSRLRKDKVAFACTVVLLLLVLLALLAPLITKWFDIYWDISDPNAPDVTDVLDFDGYPKVGPPFHPFTWDHPLHRYYKRAQWIAGFDGSPTRHRAELADLVLG